MGGGRGRGLEQPLVVVARGVWCLLCLGNREQIVWVSQAVLWGKKNVQIEMRALSPPR